MEQQQQQQQLGEHARINPLSRSISPAFDDAAFFGSKQLPRVSIAALQVSAAAKPAAIKSAAEHVGKIGLPCKGSFDAAGPIATIEPASASPSPQSGKMKGLSGSGGNFLSRTADAALKQYSRDEDRWILDQVRHH